MRGLVLKYLITRIAVRLNAIGLSITELIGGYILSFVCKNCVHRSRIDAIRSFPV